MVEAEARAPQTRQVVEETSSVGQMSQWQLMRLRFTRNRLAMAGMIGLIVMYILVFFGPFLAPNEYMKNDDKYSYGGPSHITFIDKNGKIGLQPYLVPMTTQLNKKTLKFEMVYDTSKLVPIKFFAKGDPYVLLGFIKTDVHLFGVEEPHRIYLLGADKVGRDMLARLLVGGQISMTIGLLGVALSIILAQF